MEHDDHLGGRRKRGSHKVAKVMHEYKEGSLKSGSGHKVTSRDRAVAIAMSEAGMSRRKRKRRK
jgi:hypothetical protein